MEAKRKKILPWMLSSVVLGALGALLLFFSNNDTTKKFAALLLLLGYVVFIGICLRIIKVLGDKSRRWVKGGKNR